MTRAWVDAVTDGDWRPEQQPDLDRLARLETDQLMAGTRRRRTGMGIDIDLRRENELALLARLAPFTIHAEGWARDASVFSFDDCGDGGVRSPPLRPSRSPVGCVPTGWSSRRCSSPTSVEQRVHVRVSDVDVAHRFFTAMHARE